MQISIFGLLGVCFIVLKLVGTIDWSWWLVLLPLYGGFALVFVIAVIALGAAGLSGTAKRRNRW